MANTCLLTRIRQDQRMCQRRASGIQCSSRQCCGAGAKTFGRSRSQRRYMKFRLWVGLKQYIKIIIHIEEDQASELSRYSFLKNMKNILIILKLCKQVVTKLKSEPEPKLFESWSRINGFSPVTLRLDVSTWDVEDRYHNKGIVNQKTASVKISRLLKKRSIYKHSEWVA